MHIDATKIRPILLKDFNEAFLVVSDEKVWNVVCSVCESIVSSAVCKLERVAVDTGMNDRNFGSKGEVKSEDVSTEISGISSKENRCKSFWFCLLELCFMEESLNRSTFSPFLNLFRINRQVILIHL